VHRVGMDEIIGSIAAQAAAQHGVITAAQLERLTTTDWQWRRFVHLGWLRRVAPRVYVIAGAPLTWERGIQTGLLSLGPTALVSHRAAATLHGFDRCHPEAVEFTLPRARRNRRGGATVHSTSHLGRTDAVTVAGFRVTSATRTVIDLARLRVPRTEIEAAIDSAVRLRLSSPAVLERRLAELRGRGRWGCRLLDELLIDSGGHTMLERRFLALVRHAGLPRPRTQVITRRGTRTVARVDFLYDEYQLVVEVSGQHGHASPAERSKDAQRRNELQELGWAVYEYTWHHVTREQSYVRRTLTDRLMGTGWTP
jgi:very-short-patch-repair endonuclease